MKIKWNWGTKLLIAIILFMSMLLTFAYLTTLQDHSLVEDNYYQKSLVYQKKLDKIHNAERLEENVKVETGIDFVTIIFPSIAKPGDLTGKIQFYRPSNKDYDITMEIKTDSTGKIHFPLKKLHKGKYIVKIDYAFGGKEYYEEHGIYIN